jgi:hypothetical protein
MRIESDDFADGTRLTVAIGEVAFPQQGMGQVLPDEAARTRNENPHSILSRKACAQAFQHQNAGNINSPK